MYSIPEIYVLKVLSINHHDRSPLINPFHVIFVNPKQKPKPKIQLTSNPIHVPNPFTIYGRREIGGHWICPNLQPSYVPKYSILVHFAKLSRWEPFTYGVLLTHIIGH